MQHLFGIWVALDLPQHNKVYEINVFYAEMFSFFISHGHLTPIKVLCIGYGNSFSNQWTLATFETELFKYNCLKLLYHENCASLKSVQLTLNK